MIKATAKQISQARELAGQLDNLIMAAEGEAYSRAVSGDKPTFARLLKLESKIERALRAYLKDLAAGRIYEFVNWFEYRAQARQAAELVVEADARVIEAEKKILLNVLFDFVVEGTLIGGEAGSNTYNLPVNDLTLQTTIQRQARAYSNKLVTNITGSTRRALRATLETSLALGESNEAAAARINKLVDNPVRATTIARTEAVNTWGNGLNTYGQASGARGKVWDSVIDKRTSPICLELQEKYGGPSKAIKINDQFISSYVGGIGSPGAHVNCRSGMYLLY